MIPIVPLRDLPCAGALLVLGGILTAGFGAMDPPPELPEGFVDVGTIAPSVLVELPYCTTENFVGARVDGYLHPRGILTQEAAQALARVQGDLEAVGLGLKILDAYRPQQAVDHFMRWAKDANNTATRKKYYPNLPKKSLLDGRYIAARSSHSRGSTVDVTLVSRDGGDLEMGTSFDFFDRRSWISDQSVSATARAHRLLLRTLMIKHGFRPYDREWWHFTLRDEPFPDTYFNFPVR